MSSGLESHNGSGNPSQLLIPVMNNIDGLRFYCEASGKNYFIPAEVEQMINALDRPRFSDLTELDPHTWGVLVETSSANYWIHMAISEKAQP